jgi:hypothetical protein
MEKYPRHLSYLLINCKLALITALATMANGVRINLDRRDGDDWDEIDAVELIGVAQQEQGQACSP